MNFNFLNLYTKYKVVSKDAGINLDLLDQGNACFYKLFAAVKSNDKKEYHFELSVRICLGLKDAENGYSNYVPLTFDELDWYFGQLNKVVPFTYNYKKIENEEEAYLLNIDTTTHAIKLKWLLTVIRYIYEYPFNFAITEAIKLKMAKKFVNINVINVFNIIGTTVEDSTCWNENHTVGRCDHGPLKFISFSDLSKLLDRYQGMLEDVYDEVEFNDHRLVDNWLEAEYPKAIDNDWFSLDKIIERYKTSYFPNYMLIKKANSYIQK